MNSLSTYERGLLDLVRVDDLVAVASELVRQPGENPPGGEGATAGTLARICADRGLEVSVDEVGPGRPNVSAALPGGSGPGLLLLGHTDVVPVGEGWSEEPFGGVVRDGRLHGRGSADMKGGLAACVVAMTALREAGVALDGPVELAAVVDEEETGAGIRHFLTADRSDFAGCVVAEPTDLQTIVAARGDSYVEIAVGGRSAHSGNPADGVNAIHGAARVIGAIEDWHAELAADAHPLVGPATWSTGLVRGGTGTSTVPAHCLVTADRRLLPAESGAEVLVDVRRRLDGLDLAARELTVDVTMTMEMPGFETPVDHPLVETADRALADVGGPGLPLAGWTAACDGGFVARDAHVPVVVLGAGSVLDAAHRPDESVAVGDLLVAARAYTLLAVRLLGR
jgi:acetylornithine deacetylase/succinyl-diaminopimelate desuccinylase family protein